MFWRDLPGMSVTLTAGATVVDLAQGPEWGGQESVELALLWDQMTDGRWRSTDKGILRDIWSCRHVWRIPAAIAADLREVVHGLSRGQAATLTAADGVLPLGPLVDCSSGISVRVTAAADLSVAAVSRDWDIELSIVATPHPQTQGKTIVPPSVGGLERFLTVADASPVQAPAWAVARSETSFLQVSRDGDAYAASLRAMLPAPHFADLLHQLVVFRSPRVSIPADRYPWGPGIEPNDNGSHLARVKAFTWSRVAPNLYSVSATVAQEPAP